jgi:hypothetical protein
MKDILDVSELDLHDDAQVAAFYDALSDVCRFETGEVLAEMKARGIIDENGARISETVPNEMTNPLATVHQQ